MPVQDGIEVISNPTSRDHRQNYWRRDAALFLYRVDTRTRAASGPTSRPIRPFGGPHEVPAARKIDPIDGIGAVLQVRGQAAGGPTLSEPIDLPLVRGSKRTFYEVVVVGPVIDLTGDVPPLFTDSRYFGEIPSWEAQIGNLGWRGVLADFWAPFVRFAVFGGVGALNMAKVRALEEAFRTNATQILGKYGISDQFALSARYRIISPLVEALGIDEFSAGARAVLSEAAEVNGEIALNESRLAAAKAKFGSWAKAGSFLAVVQGVFAVTDIGAVALDYAAPARLRAGMRPRSRWRSRSRRRPTRSGPTRRRPSTGPPSTRTSRASTCTAGARRGSTGRSTTTSAPGQPSTLAPTRSSTSPTCQPRSPRSSTTRSPSSCSPTTVRESTRLALHPIGKATATVTGELRKKRFYGRPVTVSGRLRKAS